MAQNQSFEGETIDVVLMNILSAPLHDSAPKLENSLQHLPMHLPSATINEIDKAPILHTTGLSSNTAQ